MPIDPDIFDKPFPWKRLEPASSATGQVGDYTLIGEPISKGGYGWVWEASDVAGIRVAIKILMRDHQDQTERMRFTREVRCLRDLHHIAIVRALSEGTYPDGRPWYAMDLVPGAKSITEYCRHCALELEPTLALFRRACDAVEHAHSQGIWHRDLKPDNILVSAAGELKLIDFGIAKALRGPEDVNLMLTGVHGPPLTPAYAAPERLTGGKPSEQWDIWALGVVLYEIVTARHPFTESPDDHADKVSEAIRTGNPPQASVVAARNGRTLPKEWAGHLDRVFEMALAKESSLRFSSVKELKEALILPEAWSWRQEWKRIQSTFRRVRKAAAVVALCFGVAELPLIVVEKRIADGLAADKQQRLELFQHAQEGAGLYEGPELAESLLLEGRVLLENGNVEEATRATQHAMKILADHQSLVLEALWTLRSGALTLFFPDQMPSVKDMTQRGEADLREERKAATR